ncbi:MAG: (Fe-S)-binding protein [Deltaproteobacteria bacterium]|nr:(Fe-S)-binding protein [Deltaproteobacteria bacterium]
MLKAVVVLVLTVGSFGLFAYNVRKLVLLLLAGRPEALLDRVGERTRDVITYVFGHQKVMEETRAGLMHLVFFYGFLILQLGHAEHVLSGMTTGVLQHPFELSFLPAPLYQAFLFSQDFTAGLIILVGLWALIRRWFHLVPRLEPRSADAEIILSFIVALYVTFFLYTTTQIAMGGPQGWFRPFATPMGNALAGLGSLNATLHEVGYWGHLFVFLAFVNYLPYSKHAHTMAALPNIFFHRQGPRGKPSVIDFDTAEVFGWSKVTELPWKTLLDSYACTECGRCNAACPAHLTGKPLQPRKVLHDIKDNLKANAATIMAQQAAPPPAEGATPPEPKWEALINKEAVAHGGADGPIKVAADGMYLSHGSIHVDEAWACTTCGACMQVCPVLIETVPSTLMEIRRTQVMMESDFPQELAGAFKNLEGQGNPWGVPQSEREKWAEGLEVPTMRDKQEVDILFWVGCAGATDDRAMKTQKALVALMKAAGLNFAVMGCEEKCTGDPARRMGNEYVFMNLCKENQEALGKYKFKEIVTTCPHCLNSLGNEYQDYGAPKWKVRHHTELLAELLEKNRIPLKKDAPAEKIVFHDPCYLGRYAQVYDAPRQSLKVLNNVELVEMERTRERSFCCGAGGGRLWMEEHIGKRVNVERTEQALKTGAQTVAVGCPFCMTMITDGTKAKGADENVKVKDVAEIIAARLTTPK